MFNKTIHIGITAFQASDYYSTAIGVIRSLKKSTLFDVRIIALTYEPLEVCNYLREFVDAAYQIPYPSAGQEALFNRLIQIQQKDPIQILFSTFDPELLQFIKSINDFKNLQINTFLPTQNQFEMCKSNNIDIVSKRYGFLTPVNQLLFDSKTLSAMFDFPVALKGKYEDWQLAKSPEQFHGYFNKISSQWGMPVLAQKVIKGKWVSVAALGNGKGDTIGAVAVEKQNLTSKSDNLVYITVNDTETINAVKLFIQSTNWQGACTFGFTRTEKNELYLLDITPRFPDWVYLATQSGQNLPEAWVSLALGDFLKPLPNFENGKMLLRYAREIVCDVEDYQRFAEKNER